MQAILPVRSARASARRLCRSVLLVALAAASPALCLGQFGQTRQVPVPDPFLHITMENIIVPAGWESAATVLRGTGCGTDQPHEVFRANSADGLTGFQFMPPVIWYDSPNPGAYKANGNAQCAHLGQTDPTEIALHVAGTRPNARVISVQKDYDDAIFQQNVQRIEQQIDTFAHGKSSISGREGRVLVGYTLNGHAEEELFMAQDVTQMVQAFVPPPNFNGRGTTVPMYVHQVTVIAFRAPAGKLASLQPAMLALIRQRQQTSQWMSAENQYQAQVRDRNMEAFRRMAAANQARSDQQLANFKAQSAATLNATRQRMAQTQAQNEQLQRTGQDQIDFLAGNQYYLNPSTGRTYTGTAGDGKTYMHDNGTGEMTVLRTTDAYQQLTMPSDWVGLVAISH